MGNKESQKILMQQCYGTTLRGVRCRRKCSTFFCFQHMDTTPMLKTELKTEDTGIIFEMAICMALNTPFVGKFKYDIHEAQKLSKRITGLQGYNHTAQKQSRFDFTNEQGEHISAKSTKGSDKVAPQCIGQCSVDKFFQIFNFQSRMDIQENILKVLPVLEEYTFSCPILYYNKKRDEILFIRQTHNINWSLFSYTFTRVNEHWKNSTTLKANGVPIMEFQIHSKSRKNIVSRWYFSNLLRITRDFFDIETK